MPHFTDRTGRTWRVDVNVSTIKACRELLGLDLLGLLDNGFAGLARLLGDVEALVNCVYVVCKREADAAGVSDEEFGRAFLSADGSVGMGAAVALVDALGEYLPPHDRTTLAKLTSINRPTPGVLTDAR